MIDAKKQQYLHWMNIDYWQSRSPTADKMMTSDVIPAQDWDTLQQQVATCTACALHCSRTQTVFGTGNLNAKIMLIGEAPGAEEDRQGKPFVGRAGKLLTEMLHAIDLTRDEVFIANILKCRPPQNRDPSLAEVEQCTPYLQQQIAKIQPKLLVALGRVAAHYLLKTKTPLAQLRQQSLVWGERQTPLFVTYHPAYLLRAPQDKAKSYVDLLKIREQL